jgi:hypothetical protein
MKRNRSENASRSRRVKQQVDHILSQAFAEDSSESSMSTRSTPVDTEDYQTPPPPPETEDQSVHGESSEAEENNPRSIESSSSSSDEDLTLEYQRPLSTTDENSSESEFDSEEETPQAKETPFIELLAEWVVMFFISMSAFRWLLAILRTVDCFKLLPKDPRTVLNTPRNTTLRSVEPGFYVHLGIANGLRQIFEQLGGATQQMIELVIGVDGVPFAKSGGHEGYPICGAVKINPKKWHVFTIGVYHGPEKPFSANDYLKELVEEATKLFNDGFMFLGQVIKVKLHNFCADAPAKSFVLYVKGHSGYYSCPRCHIKGKRKLNTTCFPALRHGVPHRTDASFRAQTHKEHHNGTTILTNLTYFNMILNVSQDYMHSCCLGVMRKLMHIFVSCKAATKGRLGNATIKLLDRNIKFCQPFIPCDFARKCRDLKLLEYYKATEYRLILLYTGPFIFKTVLSDELYRHFLLFHCGLRILASSTMCIVRNSEAAEYLKKFSLFFGHYYGKNKISYNVHVITHLHTDVLTYGPVDEFSCFKFENYYQIYRRLLRSGRKVLAQLARRLCEINQNMIRSQLKTEPDGLSMEHLKGPCPPHSRNVKQFEKASINGICIRTSQPNNCVVIGNKIVLVENLLKENDKSIVYGREFRKKTDFFRNPCLSSSIGIYKCSDLSGLKTYKLKDVCGKCLSIRYHPNKWYVAEIMHHE